MHDTMWELYVSIHVFIFKDKTMMEGWVKYLQLTKVRIEEAWI